MLHLAKEWEDSRSSYGKCLALELSDDSNLSPQSSGKVL